MSDTVDKGKTHFDALLPRIQALPEDEIVNITTNVGTAAMAVIAIAAAIEDDAELCARYQSLPEAEFDPQHLEELGELAWATFHADEAAAAARSRRTQATLPAGLVARANELERRMQVCCEYYLADHELAGPTVTHLRKGTGYRDLGQDLLGYAALYRDYEDIVSADTKHYRESDVEDAIEVGEQIIELLGSGWTTADREVIDHYVRAWTLLHRAYNEVRDAGHWLLRKQPQRAERELPSLVSLGRAPTSAAAVVSDDGGEGQG